MLWLLAIVGSALAGRPTTEEVVVWGDPFARWDDTRWAVHMELQLHDDVRLVLMQHRQLRVRHFVVDAVIHCKKDVRLGPQRYEVGCAIETVGVQLGVRPSDQDDAGIDALLAELDRRLTGATLELQVGADGTVPNIGLEGVEALNRDESRTREVARELLARVMAPFHLKWPEGGPQLGMRFEETRSALFELPSSMGTVASSRVAHYLDPLDGNWILQSIGRASSQTRMRNPYVGLPCATVADKSPVYQCARGSVEVPEYTSAEITLDLKYDGVAVIDSQAGYLTERVWSVVGEPTASSVMASNGRAYLYSGRLQKLPDPETP